MRRIFAAALVALACASPAAAQKIESELVLITPVGKSFTDPALAEFARQAKERWGVTLKTAALAAGTPVAYGRIVEWNGRPQADLFWGGESALYDRLAAQGLLAPLELPAAVTAAIPARIGAPKPVALKDPKGFWVGTVLETCGIAYHPKLLERLGVPPPKDWDDLLDPRLKGQIAQAPPTRSSSSHAAYEVILQRDGEAKGWDWLKRLAANTGFFAPRSRDVPSVVAKGEFAVGFSVPSYMAFEERLAGFDIRYVAPKTAWITSGPAAVLAGARHPQAARAFVEFLLSDTGQRIAMERGLFPIVPQQRIQGPPGSTAELAVAFNGGVRSLFEREIVSVYDDELAQKRYEEVNARYRREIEKVSGTFSATLLSAQEKVPDTFSRAVPLRVADARAPANADEAYDQVVAARKALQEAEMAQERGVEPLEGERLGTAGGKSRLSEDYWRRQESLAQEVEKARKRVDEALRRWHELR